MKAKRWIPAFLIACVALCAVGATGTDNDEVDPMDTWDLTDLYKSVDDFRAEKKALESQIDGLAAYEGKLDESAKTLLAALNLTYDLEKRMRRMESYASRWYDRDTRVSEAKAAESEVENVRTHLARANSFIDPEITRMDPARLAKFLKEEPKLAVYEFPIRETIRRREYILSEKEERILAAAGDISSAGYSAYGLFTNADMPRETITLADGSELKMTYPNFDKVRRSHVDADRLKGFQAFFGQYDAFKRTIADLLYNQIKAYRFQSTMRGYPSTLAAALDEDDIDEAIYHSLIEAAHRNLPTFHRYLKLKARALGKESLEYTDLYVPFTDDVSIPVKWDEAKQMLAAALAPMGEGYVNTVEGAFTDRWVDVYPGEGKRSGAYSSGWCYDVHPYVLMNFNDTYSDTLTLAHEMGHAMHSYHSNKAQPFATSYYSTFVAEVASTFNENLLNDYMLSKATDAERFWLLGNFLDGTIKGTFFRQIQFAEFELMIHEKVEAGEALTDEDLNKMYLDLTRTYYGHDQGIVNVPEMIAVEWAAVPHFYYNYYVFQYSTSVAAASLLSERVLAGDTAARDLYVHKLLEAGGSSDPVSILRAAGADMTKPEAYEGLVARANRYMDEMEAILDAKGM